MNSLLHSTPIYEITLLIPGKMWHLRASSGQSWFGKSAVCVEWIISPLGMWIGKGLNVTCLSTHGVVLVK